MITLILLVLAAIAAAFFATQNTGMASLTFASYHLRGIPMYLVVLVSILIGMLLSAVFSFVSSVTSSFEMYGKNTKIKEGKKEDESESGVYWNSRVG